MTAAAYLRVSTEVQSVENQRAELVQLARARGHRELAVFEEVESAAKARPVLAAVMERARSGKISALYVWSLDRLDRSMVSSINRVLELDRLGVRVVSVRESWLDTDGPVRALLIAMFGWISEQEREQLRARTRAGLARVKAQGRRLGRPSTSPVLLHSAAELVERGASPGKAARTLGISRSALQRFLAARKGIAFGHPLDPTIIAP